MLRAATRRRSELRASANAQPRLFVCAPAISCEAGSSHFGVEHDKHCANEQPSCASLSRINRLGIDRDEVSPLYSGRGR